MNDREKLVELTDSVAVMRLSEVRELADYLISNGVTIQKHGRWEYPEDEVCYKCSSCGKYANNPYGLNEVLFFDYCPNCGAKMDLEAET